jgi:CheY-like chemotaxis protein
MSTQGPRPTLEEFVNDDLWRTDVVKKVLLVEDSNDTRRMMNVLLTGYGYDVVEAVDGIEAVDQAVVEKPDLILMDIAMPIADGLFAVEVIRQHEELQEIPIIAVTAFGDLYKDKAEAAGCIAVVQKPLDFEEFEAVVQQYIS